ncbi:hypothetical protein SAMN05443574_1311 [Haloarcula vallismortis]|uniref:Uncharacterized protein n=1 Tax=Haloarcula vallismortis TaxID=28442 RepID=A0A1H3ATN5_HALVA|nr:hypothetical protein SAMN05443574_1311 [Haloarcula vallismortis]
MWNRPVIAVDDIRIGSNPVLSTDGDRLPDDSHIYQPASLGVVLDGHPADAAMPVPSVVAVGTEGGLQTGS